MNVEGKRECIVVPRNDVISSRTNSSYEYSYSRKMYGVVNLVGPEVSPRIGNVKHGPLRLPISIGGARMRLHIGYRMSPMGNRKAIGNQLRPNKEH